MDVLDKIELFLLEEHTLSPLSGTPVKVGELDEALEGVRQKKWVLYVATTMRKTIIDQKLLSTWDKAKMWLIKVDADGKGFRLREGNKGKFVYIMGGEYGQLKYSLIK